MAFGVFGKQTPPPVPPVPKSEQILEEEVVEPQKWNLHKWLGLGYRYDQQQFTQHLRGGALNTKTSIVPRNTAVFLSGSTLRWHDILLSSRASFGWLCNGTLDYWQKNTGATEPFNLRGFDLGAGYTADVQAQLGWRWRAYHKPHFGFYLIPSIGYKYSHIMNYPEGQKRFTIPTPPAVLPPGTSGFILGNYPNPNQQDWFGPYVEGKIMFRHGHQWEWLLFYQYHWPSLRSKTIFQQQEYQFTGGGATLSSVQLTRYSSVFHGHSLQTQLAGTDFRFQHGAGWNLGFHFEGSGTWSHPNRLYLKTTREQYVEAPTGLTVTNSSDPTHVLWIQYLTYLYAGYLF
jgi:hypothetical protein